MCQIKRHERPEAGLNLGDEEIHPIEAASTLPGFRCHQYVSGDAKPCSAFRRVRLLTAYEQRHRNDSGNGLARVNPAPINEVPLKSHLWNGRCAHRVTQAEA